MHRRCYSSWITLFAFAAFVGSGQSIAQTNPVGTAGNRQNSGCPADMVRVHGYCIDRWELSTFDRHTKQPLSPYYPPLPGYLNRVLDVWQVERFEWGMQEARAFPLPVLSLLQQSGKFEPVAMSVGGTVPQGYLSREVARRICKNAGKRLCSYDEWQSACRGEGGNQFPYGNSYVEGKCNVFRSLHPARLLHGNASMGHLDPRLNLIVEYPDDPLLRPTGQTSQCVSRWGTDGIYDMVGNLDEWVDDEPAQFVGGFYARSTTKGCEAKVTTHAPTYFDYSTGARCCKEAG